jgi:hypothetical protein
MNKTEQPHSYRVTVSGPGALTLDPEVSYLVAAGEVAPIALRVRRPAYEPRGAETIQFHISAGDDPRQSATHAARFLAPTQ